MTQRRRGRGRGAAAALVVLALLGGVAAATEGESYPTSAACPVKTLEEAWKSKVSTLAKAMCTGSVDVSRHSEHRDPDNSTPSTGPWTPMSEYPAGAGRTVASGGDGSVTVSCDRGGDTDSGGNDLYAMYRLVGIGANLFVKLIVEAEDDADFEWKIRYLGTERAVVTNGPLLRGDRLSVSNLYSIEWNRRVVDFDAVADEFDEEKLLVQDFTVDVTTIDGERHGGGERLMVSRPDSVKGTSTVGLKATAGTGTLGKREELGASFDWGTQKTYSDFTELTSSEREHSESDVVVVKDSLPCPAERHYACSTAFDGDFVCRDHESFSGDKGARQELLLMVLNYVSAVTVEGCHLCSPPPPPPPPTTPPPPPPPATTPPETPPTPPPATTGDSPSAPVTTKSEPNETASTCDAEGGALVPGAAPVVLGEPDDGTSCPYPYDPAFDNDGDGLPDRGVEAEPAGPILLGSTEPLAAPTSGSDAGLDGAGSDDESATPIASPDGCPSAGRD